MLRERLIDIREGTANGPPNGVANLGYEAPPSSVNYFFSSRGAFRVDSISETDLGLNWFLPLFGRGRVFIEADVLNISTSRESKSPISSTRRSLRVAARPANVSAAFNRSPKRRWRE